VSGLLEQEVRIGDVLAIGDVVLQISEPRRPCYKLAMKLGEPGMERLFQESGFSGFYCRVLQEGRLEAGQTIARVESDETRPTIASIVAGTSKQADA